MTYSASRAQRRRRRIIGAPVITAIVVCLFIPELFVSYYSYRLRAIIHRDFPANYASIGYRESDGAVLDSVKTVVLMPFALKTAGLPDSMLSKVRLLRVHRVLFYLIAVPVFIYAVSG